ncbi:MAG: bifunctional folylpolyglutamate synthase/dihydrofolate synthase [Clostridia bacterium]|nr:bifunctional folylpolyglutamate synthase/dihydrofolate synthase [Clostridia bacterium]
MNYTESVEYVHSRLKFGIKPGLERIEKLCALLGNPQNQLKFVHVAGTNGKGSICSMIASVCQAAGLRTGLFVSPYVVDFRERITLNGQYIPKRDFSRIMTKIAPLADTIEEITEFEVLTAAAFLWFAKKKCDIVVLEVGLGGRFESTNIITSPACSVIAKIALDHTKILGDTISQIAIEKCGIIKKNCPVVTYPEQDIDALSVIMEQTSCKESKLYKPNSNAVKMLDESIDGSRFSYGGSEFFVPFPGYHQIYNALTAIQVAKVLNFTDEIIADGLKNAKMPARTQIISKKPLIMVDGSHNPNGLCALSELLKKHLSNKKLIFVMGMLADKSVDEAASFVLPLADKVLCVTPDNPRAMPAAEFAETAKKYCNDVIIPSGTFDACKKSVDLCPDVGAVICCGSLYLAGDILKSFDKIL